MTARVKVERMTAAHAEAVLAIYHAGLDTGHASFETEAPDWHTWQDHHVPEHRFVAVADSGSVLGWAACSPVSDRCVYAGVVESSVYVAPEAGGRGVGKALMEALVASTEGARIWTLQAGVFPENAASIRLHEAVGFRVVGRRERIGLHQGRWRDALLLERRSKGI